MNNEQYLEYYYKHFYNKNLNNKHILDTYYQDFLSLLNYFKRDISFDINLGWLPLVINLHKSIFELDPNYELVQVKEKFGGLRYYVNTYSMYTDIGKQIHQLIDIAEETSLTICELCANPGSLRSKTYFPLKTYCDNCAKQIS